MHEQNNLFSWQDLFIYSRYPQTVKMLHVFATFSLRDDDLTHRRPVKVPATNGSCDSAVVAWAGGGRTLRAEQVG